MAKSYFKLEHPLERRQAEAARIREKYPDRIPVIVEKAERSDIPDIDKKKSVTLIFFPILILQAFSWAYTLKVLLRKFRDIDVQYLVPADLTVGQFVYVVSKELSSVPRKQSSSLSRTFSPTAAMMSAIYEENKDEDGFLYMTYSGENTFGSF
ncbi:hypothetical protein DH2020_033336 [Rehmannia glutinosa]|uniref:Autophagy-related protein n=1 Tax=Rehmannia glutinosa TaxID=99300 RepID=A0ABR0VDI3_REHGL